MKISIKITKRKILKLLIKSQYCKKIWKLNLSQGHFFLVQNNWYVKKICRGGWSGFGMAWSWDGSQLMDIHPNHIPKSQWLGGVVQFCQLKFSIGQKSWFKTAKMWGNKCKCKTLWYAPMNSKIQIFPTEIGIFKKCKICYTKLQKCERTNTNATIHDMLQWIKKSKYFPPNLRLLRSTKKLIQNCKNVKEKVKMQHSIIYYDEFEKSKNSQQSAKN